MNFASDAFRSSNHLLERFFSGLSEYAFYSQLGVTDTELVNYVSNLLIRFTKTDSLHRIRQLNGRRATEVVSMMTEAQHRIGVAKREVHRHIGDFTLFWTGLYPESLRSLQTSDKSDQFVSYCQEGKKAYEIASEIDADSETEVPNTLLHRLSEQFEMCAYGLREIRRQWEESPSSDGPIII
jgi:hypothetical protein